MEKNNQEIIILKNPKNFHSKKSSIKLEQHINYNYYKNPADLKEAKFHKECNRFGILGNNTKTLKTCPCCYNKYISKRLKMTDSDEKFAEVNPTIAIYFKFLKFTILILFLNFCISGIVVLIKYPNIRKCFIFNCEFDDLVIIEIYVNDVISKVMVVVNFIVLIFLKFFYIFKLRQFDILQQSKRVTASHFTLNVRYPINITEMDLRKEFTVLKKGWKVFKINLVYDINKYTQVLQKIINYKKLLIFLEHKKKENSYKYRKTLIKLEKKEEILKEIQKSYEKSDTSKFLTGFAFITMTKESSMHEILNFYNEPINLLNSNTRKFKIKRAYEPIDIIWENYGLSKCQSISKKITTNIISILLISGLFFLFIIIREIQLNYQKSLSIGNITLVMSISIFIAFANILLRFILKIFTKLERHRNYTTLYNKIIKKISLAYFVNIALMVNFTHKLINDTWIFWGKYSVSVNITFIMIISIFVDGLYDLLDPLYIIQKIKRVIIKMKLKRKKAVLQCEANKAYEGIEVDIPERYYQSMKVMSICFFFQPMIPYILIVGLVEQICTYWVQKYVITRRVVRPKNLDFKFSLNQIENFEFCMTAMILGYISYDIVFSGGFTKFTFILICLGSFHWFFNDFDIFSPFFGSFEKNDCNTFEENRKFFANDYDRMNPVTQKEAYLKWIHYLKNKKTSDLKSRRESLDMLRITDSQFSKRKNLNINTFNQTMYDYLEYKNISKIGNERFNKNFINNKEVKDVNGINLFLIEESANNNMKSELFSKVFNVNPKKFNNKNSANIQSLNLKRNLSVPNSLNQESKDSRSKNYDPEKINKKNIYINSSKSYNKNLLQKDWKKKNKRNSLKNRKRNKDNKNIKNASPQINIKLFKEKDLNDKIEEIKEFPNQDSLYSENKSDSDSENIRIKINEIEEDSKENDSDDSVSNISLEIINEDREEQYNGYKYKKKKIEEINKKDEDDSLSKISLEIIKEEKDEEYGFKENKKKNHNVSFINIDGLDNSKISIIKEESEEYDEFDSEDKGNIEPYKGIDVDFYDDNIKFQLEKVYLNEFRSREIKSQIVKGDANKIYDFDKAKSHFL